MPEEVLALLTSLCQQLLALLTSLCQQRRRTYGKDDQVPSDFKELRSYFANAITEWPTVDLWQPLTLFIDSVDQLDGAPLVCEGCGIDAAGLRRVPVLVHFASEAGWQH
jgi:hypothetical protein